jgi:hypothetical protein
MYTIFDHLMISAVKMAVLIIPLIALSKWISLQKQGNVLFEGYFRKDCIHFALLNHRD